MQFPVMDRMNILPSVMYNMQGQYTEFLLGSYLKFKLNHVTVNDETALYAGVWYRTSDAAVVSVRYDYNTTVFALSYDVNTSDLSSASYGRGGAGAECHLCSGQKSSASARDLRTGVIRARNSKELSGIRHRYHWKP